jgi:hypothetical protein
VSAYIRVDWNVLNPVPCGLHDESVVKIDGSVLPASIVGAEPATLLSRDDLLCHSIGRNRTYEKKIGGFPINRVGVFAERAEIRRNRAPRLPNGVWSSRFFRRKRDLGH